MSKIVVFQPLGPYKVPVQKLKWGKEIDRSALYDVLADAHGGSKRGVYVFALRTRGLTPWYVGKAVKQTFAQECSTLDKKNKFEAAMRRSNGTPVLFLLVDPSPKRPNARAITVMETELTRWCADANPDLVNSQNRERHVDWAIQGVFGSGSGKPSNTARSLRRMLDWG